MFAHFDDDVVTWWTKVRITLKGMKSYLWGRLLAVTGTALPILQGGGFIDLTTILPAIHAFGQQIEAYVYLPVITYGLAWINNKLAATRDTTPEELTNKLVPVDTVAEEAAPHLPPTRLSQTRKKPAKAKKRKKR